MLPAEKSLLLDALKSHIEKQDRLLSELKREQENALLPGTKTKEGWAKRRAQYTNERKNASAFMEKVSHYDTEVEDEA